MTPTTRSPRAAAPSAAGRARLAASLVALLLAGCSGVPMRAEAPAAAAVRAAPEASKAAPAGAIKAGALEHDAASRGALVAQADLVLPSAATGGEVFAGKFAQRPSSVRAKVPVVVFLHGSSGLGLKAIGEWQRWLATLGIASIAPDSFALPGRATYTSPVDVAFYERIHALRSSEIAPVLQALKAEPWVDTQRLVLAGTSEGAVPVARWSGTEFAARILYAWSCERNYFVAEPRNAFEPAKPVLNVISAHDPYFSRSNGWVGNDQAQGHCGATLKDMPNASVLLIPQAPHTVLGMPAARDATAGFLARVLR